MIPTKPRRIKGLKLPKYLERLYKQAKCRDCKVVVTRMDFAKILGKFTKVKIQFETNTPKAKRTIESLPNSRLKSNENGMVQIHPSAYNPRSARKLLGVAKKTKNNENSSPRQTTNVLKENNRLKRTEKTVVKDLELDYDYKNIIQTDNAEVKCYGIVFTNPLCKTKDVKCKISLDNLLPSIDRNVLPSEDWCIDYFPKKGEPKDDKIYDRIAAELEDLMYNEKTKNNSDNKDGKNDEFPSILDILNDTSKGGTDKTNDQSSSSNLESSDVEAMLLGKTKSSESVPMDIDNVDVSEHKPLSNSEKTNNTEGNDKTLGSSAIDDNPNSPSILGDEQSEVPEVPVLSVAEKPLVLTPTNDCIPNTIAQSMQIDENDNTNTKNKNNLKTGVTQVIFKKTINGTSSKTVICLKNLKYTISIQGKSIELLGAPKVISSLEDLQVLLQIVEESELTSLYVLH